MASLVVDQLGYREKLADEGESRKAGEERKGKGEGHNYYDNYLPGYYIGALQAYRLHQLTRLLRFDD